MYRARLLEWLRKNLTARGTLIIGPAGYGKTVLLAQFAAEAGGICCRHMADLGDVDGATLLRNLVARVARQLPGFGAAVLGILEGAHGAAGESSEDREQSLRAAVRLFATECRERVRDQLTLVVDDCHLLAASAESALVLDLLLTEALARYHLILAGRQAPALPSLPRLVARREVLRLGHEALALTPDETRDLVLVVGQLPNGIADEEAVAALHARTGGWPMAVALIASTAAADGTPLVLGGAAGTGTAGTGTAGAPGTLGVPAFSSAPGSVTGRDGRPSATRAQISKKSREALFSYLAVEVLSREPREVQSVLLDASVLPELDARRCAALLGRREAEVRRLLHEIEARSLFIRSVDDAPVGSDDGDDTPGAEEERYRIHDLFRDFLRSRLRMEQAIRFRWLQRRASILAERSGDLPQAIEHALAGQHFRRAARLIEQASPPLIASDQWQTLRRWFKVLPEHEVARAPRLIVLMARVDALLCLSGAAGADEEGLRRAERLLGTGSLELLELSIIKAAVIHDHGDYASAVAVCRDVIRQLGEDGPALLRAQAHLRLALSMRPQGELFEATKHAECALAIYQAVGDNAGRARAYEVLGITELRRGRLPQAVSALETAQTTWRSLGNRLALARTLNNLGLSLHYQGAYAAAAEMFGEAAMEARTLGYTALEACALLSVADVHRDQGVLDRAMEGYERGLALARKISSDYLVRYATDAAGQVHRLSGRLDQAEVHALRAIHLSSQPGARQEEGCYRRSLAMVYLARGEHDRARATIEEAVRLLERAGAQRDLAHAYFCRAQIAHSARQRAELRLTLEALERLLASLGYHGFLSSEAKRALPVIEYGIVKGCAGPRLRALRDAAVANAMSATPPLSLADDVAWFANSPDSREASTPQAPTYRAAPVPLALEARAFGQSRIQCAAQSEISLAWRGKKSKELLFYLLCNPGWLRREQIEAEVWSEASEGQVRGAFHTNVYRLRRALGTDVLEEYEGHYRLNSSASMWFDVHEFERCCAELTSLPDSPSMVQIAREALALYRGPFLDDLAPEWAQPIRDRLEALYLDLCLRLGRYRASKGEFEEAETLARRALAVAPYLERAHELVMVCQAAAGRPAAALHHYGRYAEQLTRELGATPSAAVTATQERILRGELVAVSR